MNSENSLFCPMVVCSEVNNEPTGLVMAAWIRGFWRRMAASRVEPLRGRPEMKWKVFGMPWPAREGFAGMRRCSPALTVDAERKVEVCTLAGRERKAGEMVCSAVYNHWRRRRWASRDAHRRCFKSME